MTNFKKIFSVIAVLSLVFLPVTPALAADGSWNVNAAGNWSNAGNWSGGTVADGTDGTATFPNIINATRAITLDSIRTIGNITASDTSNNYTISGANMLTLDVSSGVSVIDVTTSGRALGISAPVTINDGLQKDGAGNVSFSGGVTLGGAQTWTNDSSGSLTVTNANLLDNAGYQLTIDGTGTTVLGTINNATPVLTGSGNLVKDGTGRLEVGGVNAGFTGTVTINGGILEVHNNAGVLGNGNLTINDGVLSFYWSTTYSRTLGTGNSQVQILGGESGFAGNGTSGPTINLGATVVWGASGEGAATGYFNPTKFVLGDSGTSNNAATTFSSGIDLNAATRTILVPLGNGATGNKATISGIISNSSGTAGLIKEGDGTLILNAANTYNGGTTLQAGTLQLGNNASLGSTSGQLAVNSGLLDINDKTVTVGNLTGTGGTIANNASNARTLTIGSGDGTGGNFAGIIVDNTDAGASSLALTKTGSGTITLSGANTYTGVTTISGGTLQIGAGGTTGTLGAGGVTNNATLAFNRSNDLTASNIISGTGALTKEGAGVLTLSGANTYTGATTVNAGTLQAGVATVAGVSGAFGVNSAVTLADTAGAILDLNDFNTTIGSLSGGGTTGGNLDLGSATLTTGALNTADTYAGIISGTGALTKAGTNSLTLNGTNTHSGGTTLTSGTLNIGNTNALGTGTFAINGGTIDNTSGSALTLATNNPQTWGGDFAFTGTNDLNLGSGAVTMTGATRTVTANAGNLIVGGAIGDGGNGYGLTKAGAGTLTMNGINTYTGATAINAGTLGFGSNTTLGGNLTLTGGGGGTLDLGTYTSTLGAGAFSMTGAGETLRTTFGGSTIGNLTGNTNTINNGTLNVVITGTPTPGTYTVVTDSNGAATGVNTTAGLALTTTGNSRFNFALVPGAALKDLQLSVTRGAATFETIAGGGNAAAVGSTLDEIADSNPTGDMATVISALDVGTDAQDETAMNSMMPDVSSGTMQASRAVAGMFASSVSNRLGFVRSGIAQTGVATGDMFHGTGFWMQGLGSHVKQDTRKGIEGYQANTFGTMIGVDQLIDQHYRLGLAAGYGFANVNSKTIGSPGTDINSFQGMIYGSYDSLDLCKGPENQRGSKGGVRYPGQDSWYVDGMFGFTQNNYDSRREVYLPASTRIAKADHYGQQYSTELEVGYTFVSEKLGKLETTPFASLGYNYLYMNKYKEDGAGALNLTVDGEGFHELLQVLGMKFAYPIVSKKLGTFIPSVKAAWTYDYIGDQFETTAKFAGGGPSFDSKGAKPARNGMLLGGEIAFLNKGNMTLTGNYDMELKDEYRAHTYYGTARFDF